MAYVPHGQLATWPINHVAKISSLKKFKKISIFEKKKKKKMWNKYEYFSHVACHMVHWPRDKNTRG
jgi:hypothetical protein